MFFESNRMSGKCWSIPAGGIFLLCLWFALFGGDRAWAADGAEEQVSFKWAFGAMVGGEGGKKLEAITHDRALKTGDQLKMMVELQRECFVYVFYHNPREGFKMLFPYNLQQLASNYQPFTKYYIPQGDGWFELDEQTGRETFYLLASKDRLTSIEKLYQDYEGAEPASRAELAKQLLAEIKTVRKQHREYAVKAERPVAIGGALRGIEKRKSAKHPDVAAIADDVLSSGFIARTFTIEHQ